MEKRYFYVCEQVEHKQYDVRWHPFQENLDNYTSKDHIERHNMKVHTIYLHMKNSQQLIQRAMISSDLQGCVGKAAGGYIWGHTLPLIPSFRL